MKNKKLAYLPTILTLANLFCGFSSILLVAAGRYESAVWIIIMAALFDAFDGRVARASGGSSEFGLQMDSLSDVISFGMAPSFLIYQYYFKSVGLAGIFLAFMPVAFAALRLARFNITAVPGVKSNSYVGLASPMAAISLTSIVLLHLNLREPGILILLFVLTPVVSLLMMSTVRYSGFPLMSLTSGAFNSIKLLLLLAALAMVPIFPHFAIFAFMMLYLVSGPLEFLISADWHPVAAFRQNKDIY